MKHLLPIVALFCGVAMPVPDAPARPHPTTLRRDRLNRQLAHTRGKGHR